MAYAHISLSQLLTQLSERLDDSANTYWSTAELTAYIQEALRTWQALTGYWRNRWKFDVTPAIPFYDLTAQAQTLIPFTLKDSDLVSVMLYQLLEKQLSGGAYVGTDMFVLDDFTKALERRRNQFLVETGMVLSQVTVNNPSPPEAQVIIPDTVIDVRRCAWLSPSGTPYGGDGRPSVFLVQKVGDTFQRANENPLNPANWTVAPPTFALQVLNNQCVATGNPALQPAEELYTGFAWPNDQWAQVQINVLGTSSDDDFGILLRRNLVNHNGYYCLVTGGLGAGIGEIVVTEILVPNTIKLLDLTGLTLSAGDTITFAVVGVTFYVFQNGVLLGSILNADVASGSAGLYISNHALVTEVAVSNFLGGSAFATLGFGTPSTSYGVGPYNGNFGTFTNLWRSSEYGARAFQPLWALQPQDPPAEYSVAAQMPLVVQIIPPPLNPGQLRMLCVQTGTPLNPTAGVLMGVPDNLAWVVKWGALADLLSKDGQAQDLPRAQYCEQRWKQGIQIARIHTSAVYAAIDGVDVPINALESFDAFNPTWMNTIGPPTDLALASWNMLAVSPPSDSNPHSIRLDVMQNAPVPVLPGDQVQIGREELDAILDYCEHLAAFKMGGQEFLVTSPLVDNMIRLAGVYNERLKANVDFLEVMADRAIREENLRKRRVPIELTQEA